MKTAGNRTVTSTVFGFSQEQTPAITVREQGQGGASEAPCCWDLCSSVNQSPLAREDPDGGVPSAFSADGLPHPDPAHPTWQAEGNLGQMGPDVPRRKLGIKQSLRQQELGT